MSHPKTATALVAGAGVAIAAAVGYLLQKEARERSEARAAVGVVAEATAELRRGLKGASPQALEKVEAAVRVAQGWSNAELADAAEQYLVGAREILRRRADANRLAHRASASRAALAAHMNRAGRRDPSWIRTASDLKKQVERDHFDLDVQLGALADLLDGLPEANKRLEPHVQRSLLLEDKLRASTHHAVLQEAKRARAELDRTRALLPR